jgi:hypothetical protein
MRQLFHGSKIAASAAYLLLAFFAFSAFSCFSTMIAKLAEAIRGKNSIEPSVGSSSANTVADDAFLRIGDVMDKDWIT